MPSPTARCWLVVALCAWAVAAGCRGPAAAPDANAASSQAEKPATRPGSRAAAPAPPPGPALLSRQPGRVAGCVRRLLLDRRRCEAFRARLNCIAVAAVQQYYRDPNTWIAAGDGAMEAGDWPQAAQHMRRAVALDPDALAPRRALAVALTGAGDYAAVIGVYEDVLKRDGSDTTARFNLAMALTRQRDFARAEEEYRRLLNTREDFVQGWYNLATILHAQGKLHEAVRAWRRVIDLAPKMAGTYASLGELLIDLGRPQEAMKVYADATAISPLAAGAWLNLANAAQACGSYGKALAALEKAAELAPRDAVVWSRLGEGYMDLYRQKEEQRFLERAVEALGKSLEFGGDEEVRTRLANARAALAATTRRAGGD